MRRIVATLFAFALLCGTALAATTLSSPLITTVNTGITAAGSTQGTATAITGFVNVVSTVPAGSGVVLAAPVSTTVGQNVYITNTGVNTLAVYPESGATITQVPVIAANAPVMLTSGTTLHLLIISTTVINTVP